MNRELNKVLPALTKSKESFKKEVEERIKEGKKLLTYEVIITRTEFSKYSLSGKRTIYDETSEQEFHSLYSKWRKYNIDLLSYSFNISENK